MNTASYIANTLEALYPQDGNGRVTIARAFAQMHHCSEWSSEFLFAASVFRGRFDTLEAQLANAPISERSRGQYRAAANELLTAMTPPNFLNQNLGYLLGLKHHVDTLHFAADVLPNEEVQSVPLNIRDALEKQLVELIAAVKAADLDSTLTSSIIAQLELILFAIRAYEHLGPDGAAKAFGAAVAELNRVGRTERAKSSEDKSTLKKVWSTVKTVGGALAVLGGAAHGAHDLLTYVPEVYEAVVGVEDVSESVGGGAGEVEPAAEVSIPDTTNLA